MISYNRSNKKIFSYLDLGFTNVLLRFSGMGGGGGNKKCGECWKIHGSLICNCKEEERWSIVGGVDVVDDR